MLSIYVNYLILLHQSVSCFVIGSLSFALCFIILVLLIFNLSPGTLEKKMTRSSGARALPWLHSVPSRPQ